MANAFSILLQDSYDSQDVEDALDWAWYFARAISAMADSLKIGPKNAFGPYLFHLLVEGGCLSLEE